MAKKYLLILIGWISVVLGVIGALLPIMPTTPFILLAAWCFARSSERFHQWLLNQRHLGPIVRDWDNGEGLPYKLPTRLILLAWFSLLTTSVIVHLWYATGLLTVVGLLLTMYLSKLPVKYPVRREVLVASGSN
jgi:uncharacterized membrane protein YbaN (DUF454 family)